jgi:DNA-3-methyladenine glycosylase
VTRSSPDLHAPIWSSEWDEVDTTIARPRLLDRAEIPVDTAQHAYVYAYGSLFMLNVSSEAPGVGAGVLIRAIEPTHGVAIMEQNRGTERVRDLARGPRRLSAALGIDVRLDGIDLFQAGPLWLGSDDRASGEIGQSKRIGITRAADSLLRFYVRGNRFVSGPQALNR